MNCVRCEILNSKIKARVLYAIGGYSLFDIAKILCEGKDAFYTADRHCIMIVRYPSFKAWQNHEPYTKIFEP